MINHTITKQKIDYLYLSILEAKPEKHKHIVNDTLTSIYISPDGKDDSDCGAIGRPCFTIFKGDSKIRIGSNYVFYLLPGYYDYSNTTLYNLSDVNFTMIGVAGPKQTKIKLSSGGRFVVVVRSVFNCIGITFLNSFTPRSYNSFNTAPNFRNVYSRRAGVELTDFKLTIAPFKIRNSNATLINIYSFNNSIENFLASRKSEVAIINSTFQLNDHDSLFEANYCKFTIYQSKIFSNDISVLVSSNFSEINIISTSIYYNKCEQGFFFNTSAVTIYNCIISENVSIFGQLILATSYMNMANVIIKKNIGLGVTSILFHNFDSASNETIFSENISPVGSVIVNEARSFTILNTLFTGQTPIDTTSISIYGNGELFALNSVFHNLTGTCVTSDSQSIIVFSDVSFLKVQGKIVQSFGKGEVFFGSCIFEENTAFDHLIYLSNKVSAYCFNSRIISNKCASFFEINFESSLRGVNMIALNNFFQDALITGSNSFGISLQYSSFINNLGVYKGVIFQIDQSGSINITDSLFYGNKSPFGTFIYFRKIATRGWTECNNNFMRNTFNTNTASSSGALVYFEYNVTCPFICEECFESHNVATFGDLVNSEYWNFTVLAPNHTNTPQNFQVVITALDAFGNRVLGRNDVSFLVDEQCPNVNLTGIKTTILNSNGISIMYNLQLSGEPGTSCVLNFTSDPPSKTGPVYVNLTLDICTDDHKVVSYQSQLYCLKKGGISDIVKLIITSLMVVEFIIVIIAMIITIIYRNNRLIVHSNIIFLLTVLVGCLLLLGSIITSEITADITCILRNIIIPAGLFITSLSVIAKQIRLWSIRRQLNFQKKTLMKTSYFFKCFGILSIVPAIIISLNAIVSPLKPTDIINLNNHSVTHVCTSQHGVIYVIINLVYLVLLLLVSCVLIFLSRDYRSSPGTFNEPTYIAILIYNYLLLKQAVVLSMMKFIEEQEQQLDRNRDILMFYELYGNDEGKLNFANHNIFTPDTPSPSIQHGSGHINPPNDNNNLHNNNSIIINQYNKNISHGLPSPPNKSTSDSPSSIPSDTIQRVTNNHINNNNNNNHINHRNSIKDLDAIYGSMAFNNEEPMDSPFTKSLKSKFSASPDNLNTTNNNNNNNNETIPQRTSVSTPNSPVSNFRRTFALTKKKKNKK
ncbi:G-protein-coupled receptor family 3 protein [Heterostelium album PN500]|uniref:G-protein-coupled receptor family 3 protein n=1 Tax=Heterostelium pallidum (strain ATCC 26659 / Pp 5 / PN500) TaxID=670386 RepID=D3BPG9_HETP5|nr:G-protein-coupled receptor family 3 protein [Heterostelium album PN500]EFA76687.1 G-protein-coupled receptor family 3 protein [Heterostelium album PN500]|eukprot:XP_020428819.1 G-protein-coupled receptor family 3 protein [Heterostelium album PN500]